MAELRLIGAVGVKVRPDTSGFRVRTRREIERELKDYEPEVRVEGKVDLDSHAADSKLDRLAKRALKIHGDVDLDTYHAQRQIEKLGKDGRRELQSLQRTARDAKNDVDSIFKGYGRGDGSVTKFATSNIREWAKGLREVREAQDSVNASLDRFAAKDMRLPGSIDKNQRDDLSKLKAWNTEYIKGTKAQIASLNELGKAYKASLADAGFGGIQNKINQLAGSTAKLGRISDDTASDVGKAVEKMMGHWNRFDAQQRRRTQTVLQSEDNVRLADIEKDFKVATERARDYWKQFTTKDLAKMLVEGAGQAADDAADELGRRLRGHKLENMFGEATELRRVAQLAAKRLSEQTADNARIEFENIRHEADKTEDHINSLEPKMVVGARGFLETAAQLAYASRDRQVSLVVKVSSKSLAVAEGVLRSISGINTIENMGRSLEAIFTKLDTFALRTATIATVLAGVADTLVYAASAALSIGEGVAEVVGLTATAPALILALASGVLVNVAAWTDFKAAVDGSEEALARLPQAARNAAVAIRGSWDDLQNTTQNAFWESMGTSLQDSYAKFLPVVTEGFKGIAGAAGSSTALFFDSLSRAADDGSMETTFGNVQRFFEGLATTVTPLSEAIGILGLRGSEYLPRFGEWLGEISTQFRDWIKTADENDDINRWIEDGIQSLKDMWSISGSVINMFKGLNEAAQLGGLGNLTEFAENLKETADTMNREPFRSNMGRIFAGARKGASELNVGVKDLNDTIGDSSAYIETLLEKLGKIGGTVLSGVSNIFGNTDFQSGSLDAVKGMQSALDILEPSFDRIGSIVGKAATLAGQIFTGVAPLINSLVDLLGDSVDVLGPSLGRAVVPLTKFVQGIIDLAAGPLSVVVGLVAGLADWLADLPGPMANAVLGLAAFLALRGQIGGFFANLNDKSIPVFTKLSENWRLQSALARGSSEDISRYRVALATIDRAFPQLKGLTDHLINAAEETGRMGKAARDADGEVKESFKSIGDGADAMRTQLGGIWEPVTQSARESGEKMRDGITSPFKNAGLVIRQELEPVRQGFADLAQDNREQWQRIVANVQWGGEMIRYHSGQAGDAIGTFAKRGADVTGLSTVWTNAMSLMSTGSDKSRDSWNRFVQTVNPTDGRFRQFADMVVQSTHVMSDGARDTAGKFKMHMGAAAGHLGELSTAAGRAAGELGKSGAGGLRAAAGGLSEALGGPWGIAIMAAITLMGLFGAKAQAAAAKVDALKASLNADTGAYTPETVKRIADAWTDLEDIGDPMANITRGAKAANETVAGLGIPLADVTQMIIDGGPKFAEFRDGLQAIAKAKDVNFNWRQGKDQFDELTAASDKAIVSLGLNKELLENYSGNDIQHVVDNITEQEVALRLSELAWKGVADASGQSVPAAQAMAQAMETIGNNSLDAAGKIDAIRTSLDLLKGGTLTAQEAQMAAARAQTQAVEGAKALAAEIASSGQALFDAEGMLNSQTTIGQQAYTLMKSSSDSLLIEAQAAYDAAILGGATAEAAGDKAMAVMDKSDGRLQQLADAMGVNVDDLRVQWESFFGADWQLEATFSANASKVQEAMQIAKDLGYEWDGEEFLAFLQAQPDPAKVTAEQITQYMKDKMAEDFIAQLKAIPTQAQAAVDNIATNMKHWKDSDYTAWLKAQDKTHPGIAAAVENIRGMTGGSYQAALEAINATWGGISDAKYDLSNVPTELVDILSQWLGIPPRPQVDDIVVGIVPVWRPAVGAPPVGTSKGLYADGGLWDGRSDLSAGRFPATATVKMFANGGIENHTAQIAYKSTAVPYRIWAEAEGGEAYIPLSSSKRSRSTAILDDVANMFGYDLIPRNAMRFADGGFAGKGAASLLGSEEVRPINITINGVPLDNADKTADVLLSALKQAARGGVY